MLENEKELEIIHGRVVPNIYAFTTDIVPEYVKVGFTNRPVSERLCEWKRDFPDLKKMAEASAKVNDDTYFMDIAVHQYLEHEKSKERLPSERLKQMAPQIEHPTREFFKDVTYQDILDAIQDVKDDYANHGLKYRYYSAIDQREESTHYVRNQTYELRPNQKKAVDRFKEAVDDGRTNLLMYAVMRFGKSFTSMCCAVEMNAKLVVVVSAKADVMEEWKKTVESHVKFDGYEFISDRDLELDNQAVTKKLNTGNKAVVFLTLQTLNGPIIKDRHKEIFGQKIDLLIIDESHFGARGDHFEEVWKNEKKPNAKKENDDDDPADIEDVNEYTKKLNHKITLHLSGTPYRIMMGSEFKKEDIISFYQFKDIAVDQKQWYIDNRDKPECENPYFGFPQMIRFAFNLNESALKKLDELKENGQTYALSALFAPESIKSTGDGLYKKFKYEKEVIDFLEAIGGSKDDENILGFLDYDKIKKGEMCHHIVMVLPYRASCDAMEELIKNNKNKFKNLGEYEILNISGVHGKKKYKSPEVIQKKITDFASHGKKTITLTVNRMLTGSTVPEWDTMIYLKETKSPQEYDQATFRIQSQYVRPICKEGTTEVAFKEDRKPQTLLVDFDPNRMFAMQEARSKIYNDEDENKGNSRLKERIDKELDISPIITINHGEISRVTATNVMEAVSNYNKNRGILEEVYEIDVDLSILEDEVIRGAIEQENPIGDRRGLLINPYPAPDPSPAPDPEPGPGPEPEPGPDKKDPTKQIRANYTRILLFAFLTKTKVISLSDIINSLSDKDNKRIAKDVGLDKEVLFHMNRKMRSECLSSLEYKIQDLNDLSMDSKMSPEEKIQVAFKKFGKLGEAVVITPTDVCDNMVNSFSDDYLRNLPNTGGKMLDIAGTAGEFASAMYKRLSNLGLDKKFIKDAIYTIPKNSLCYELVRKAYETLGLNIENIAEKFTSQDLLKVDGNSRTRVYIEYNKISKILQQDKPFNMIELTDEPNQENK